tara:strand:- start:1145 stop:1378 length:234 start_codon:yes stop_codon:yes gene_type:complete
MDLFELDWEKEWREMPEFIQEKQQPYAKIVVRFADDKDLQEFAGLIGQRLNAKTKSIWHPKLVRGINSKKKYVNENK